ncbi:Dyp-type peroxidase [Paraburkholderia fungorum]|uniref:Dyp-type peroxidase n=1 Tax=Paraburkholderia fungorum TaxID=134537 RepID=UPI0038BA36FF
MDDIQGICVPGFFKPHQVLLGIRYARERADIVRLRQLLSELAADISTAARTLTDRRGHRQDAKPGATPREWPPLVAIGFGFQGLFDLTPGAADIPGIAFQNGLVRRSALLGDPTDPSKPGHPQNWSVGGPGKELDILLIVAGDDPDSVAMSAAKLKDQFHKIGATVECQVGHVRDDVRGEAGHEHFGFNDGVSQPGIRGRASNDRRDLITDRHVHDSQFPAAALFGYPGQDLVWPGEFVIGYPKSGPDPLIPGPVLEPAPSWTRNGSFLVYRRLLQDVGLFWRTMRDEAERLSQRPGFATMDDVALASRLVGRWPSGAPVERTPGGDDKRLGRDQFANNHFRFDSDTPALKVIGHQDNFAQAKADPIGATCPLAAHIRKVNTRDAPSDMGARSATYDRRILRVGVAFGPSLEDRYAIAQPGDPERGLLFLSIQSSIEDQFEFLQARWINDDTRPKSPGGHDMIVGQNAATADGVRRCLLFGDGFRQAKVEATGQFVTASGGGYFFVPSIHALRTVLGGIAGAT